MSKYLVKLLVICILVKLSLVNAIAQDITKADSLFIALNNATPETEKANLMLSISKFYLSVANDSVEKYAVKAIELFRKNANPEKAVETLFILAESYKYQGFIDQAIATILNHMKWIKKLESPIHEANCLRALGEMSRASGQFEIGLNYIDDALQILTSIKDSMAIAKCMNRKAAIYYEIKKLEPALKYADSSLFIARIYDDVDLMINNLDILGAIYSRQGKYNEALSVQFESISLSGRMDDASSIMPNVYRNIAQTYFSMGQLYKAIEYADKSYTMADKNKIWIYMENASEMLALIYEEAGNYKKAYRYSQITKGIRDGIFKREMSDKISELNAKYEAEKRERLIQAQHDEIIKNQLKFEQEKTKRKFLYGSIIGLIVVVLLLVYIYYQKRYDNLQITKQSKLIVKKNTELLHQKEEILVQRDEIERQRDMVINQKKEITDSIIYAKRIQTAVLPPHELISKCLSQYFVLYKPRDIVSGDFYWLKEIGDNIIIAVADCTGHGVPGAFMSMLGVSLLNEIVDKKKITQPNMILEELRKYIKASLHQTGQKDESSDGMDMALCSINLKSLKMQYAGANNSVYIIRNKNQTKEKPEFIELEPDPMPIGIFLVEYHFNNQEIQLKSNDCIYLFSDGYSDQFGGENNKKFMKARFKELMVEISPKAMQEQKKNLERTFYSWKGSGFQVDDVLVMGFRI